MQVGIHPMIGSLGSGKRGESKHKALKKAFKQNGYRKLEIVFEANDQKTFKPTYFDLQPHLNDETVIKINGKDKTVGSLVKARLQRDFARRYSDNKCKFKDMWFNKKTVEQARQEKPPKWKVGDAQWQNFIDFWSYPNRMKQSERNAANRAKNKFEENQRYEGLIDRWRRCHSDKVGNFRTRENETLYSSTNISDNNLILYETEMKAIQDAITAGTIPPQTDRQILAEVTRSINRAHIAGVGRNLAGTSNLDSGRSQPDLGYCTREKLEDLKRQHALEKKEQRKAFKSQQNALKKFVDFFNRQQGTPSSQFQIPDLYTPQGFPSSISTPGGPSSSSPALSSTPLGLGNCYTPTFDLETSQSGKQEDNASDDGNQEYDVDIYDDE
nr:hypothetical protein [Tanacetum cinerariifolium]